MRSVLLFFLALGVFIAAYAAVAWLMPDPEAGPRRRTAVVPTEPRQADHVIGDIDGVTLRTHDAATGAPVAEIRIGEYRRSGENQVLLRRIEATVLMEGGSGVVTLTAPTGTVDLEAEAAQEDRLTAETLGTADIARLNDVIVRYYEDPSGVARGPSGAQLTLRVNNLIYDNKRFSLFTADTVIDGATVLADDVPVEVRGRDYDFDGRGLVIRWDASTRRPTFFRVARGQRLTIKTDQALLPERIVQAPGGTMLASLDPGVAAHVLEQPAIEPYVATLASEIRAVQGEITLLEADLAQLLFSIDALPEKGGSEPAAPTQPAKRQAPATGPAEPKAPFVPITVFWQGELRIEAASDPSRATLASADDMHLALSGTPLILRQEEVEARGLELRYQKIADALELTGNESTPVTLVDAEQNTLVTTRLFARPSAGTATATTPGYADVIAGGGEAMQLRWQETCDFVFEKSPNADPDGPAGGNQLKSISAQGAVSVRHPDVWLDSGSLDVTLGTPAEGKDPELRSVLAAGGSRAVINPQKKDERTLDSDKLSLEMAEGLEGPVVVLAEGNVDSSDGKSVLKADTLQARLVPDEAGDLEMAELVANGSVEGSEVDGPRFRSDVMIATPIAGRRRAGEDQPLLVRLEGVEGRNAVVEVGADVLAAPALEFNTADETVHVPGTGEVYSVQQDASGTWPLVVNWTGSMLGTQQRVLIDGEVRLEARHSGQEAGAPSTFIDVRAGNAEILLVPTEQPPEQEARAKGPTSRPVDWSGEIQQVTLRRELRGTVEERLNDTLQRSFDLRAELLDVWPVGDQARLVIDSPGRILYRDLRPPTPPPAGEREAAAPTAGGFRGNAAVEWTRRLGYEPDTGLLQLDGGVAIVIEPARAREGDRQPAPRPFRLDAEQVRVRSEQVESPNPGGGKSRRTELRHIEATGLARFSTEGVSFEAGQIEFDPATNRITATGAQGTPVVVFDADGVPTGRFAELVYNLDTGQVERLRDLSAGG